MKLALYLPQILLSAVAIIFVVRMFISLYSMRPAGRPKAVLLNTEDNSRIVLTTYETSLGRGRSCDIQLNSQFASRAHAVISRRKTGWFITDTDSKSGTYVNGSRIEAPMQIYHDDQVSIGGVEYLFIAPSAVRGEENNIEEKIKVTDEKCVVINRTTGFSYPVSKGRLSIGRTDDNDIVIDDPYVSRHHAVIISTAEGWFVIDTDSTAGVGVNGYKVNGREQLADGDTININTHQFIFRLNGGGASRGR